jgi:hypothetical protein
MPRVSSEKQSAVFNAFEDLKDFGVPAEEWGKYERGGSLNWPATVQGGTDHLAHMGNRSAVLCMMFESEGMTAVEFNDEVGKIKAVYRTIGEVPLRSMLMTPLRHLVVPNSRPDETDYDILAQELRAGLAYYRHEALGA